MDSPTKPVTTSASTKGVMDQLKRKNHAVARHSVQPNRSFKVTIQSAKHRDSTTAEANVYSDIETSDSEKLLGGNRIEKESHGQVSAKIATKSSNRKHFLK